MSHPLVPRHRAGFTLIELMVSVSLGILIIYTAFAGLRVVSQSITRSNALAKENALLRCGMQMAFDEVDFWTSSDDPNDVAKQPLRAVNNGAGLPFSPFRAVKDPIKGGTFIDNDPGLNENIARPRGGWNPNPLAWAAWDSRTWVRANMTEKATAGDAGPRHQNWGTFGIYENLNPAKSWHHWYGGQVLGLMDALGFYGAYEYLPSNAFLMYHTENRSQHPQLAKNKNLSWGGCPIALMVNDDWWGNADGRDETMKGRVRNSNGAIYYLPGPSAALANKAREFSKAGYEGRDSGWNINNIRNLIRDAGPQAVLLQTRPETWSNVSFSVHRMMTRARFTTVATVTSVNPITGAKFSFSFKTLGTTLRGARQQRLPTVGWADPFDGPTLDYDRPNPLP